MKKIGIHDERPCVHARKKSNTKERNIVLRSSTLEVVRDAAKALRPVPQEEQTRRRGMGIGDDVDNVLVVDILSASRGISRRSRSL